MAMQVNHNDVQFSISTEFATNVADNDTVLKTYDNPPAMPSEHPNDIHMPGIGEE